MKILCLALLLGLGLHAAAQPDDLLIGLTNPCGMPPNDSLDLTGDGIADLEIGGWSVGTDDEPSSSGSCTRFVRTLPGTTLLCGLNHAGDRVAQPFHVGDTVPALDTGIRDDLQIPRFMHTDATIIAWQWGYGHQAGPVVPTPGLAQQVFVFRTTGPHGVKTGTFSLEPWGDPRSVRCTVRSLYNGITPHMVR
jgi:hypothetical protein